MADDVAGAVEDVARTSYGRLVAYLAAQTGDIAAAEDALADAFVAALRTWPVRGVPDRPVSWMITAARRSLIGDHRRRDVAARAAPGLARLADGVEHRTDASVVDDKRLELLFACAHPAIDASVHAPLMLQTVLGVDVARMAGAFLVSPATLGQQLVRAKRKIRAAGVPFALPRADDLAARAGAVLDAIYAAYATGWDDPLGLDARRAGLVDESVRLAELVCTLLGDHAEAHGLAALLLHSRARLVARRGPDGGFVPLTEQDVQRWSRQDIGAAEAHLDRAVRLGVLGPYQLQAAIQSLHNRRAATGRTDWEAIALLYRGLVALAPTAGAVVAAAAAVLEAEGPGAAAELLAQAAGAGGRDYQPYWVVAAEIGRRRADPTWRDAAERAVALAEDAALRRHLQQRFDLPG